MVVLGLDTTTKTGGVALHETNGKEAVCIGDSTLTHGERLPGEIIRFLDQNMLTVAQVDRFAVVSGPGSFTGLRVGLATVQALALTNEKHVVAVPTLEAIAYAGLEQAKTFNENTYLVPWMNAFRGEVFSGVYEIENRCGEVLKKSDVSRLKEVEVSRVGKPDSVLREWKNRLGGTRGQLIFLAADQQMDVPDLEQSFGKNASWMIGVWSLALTAARIGAGQVGQACPVRPDLVRPVYIRRPDAVLARERRLKELSDSDET
tara:strand:- start:957 stop:1739 length:783 start_codon:yes stop_codon:yes gene_type:complete